MFLGNFVKRLGQVMDVSAIKMKYYYYEVEHDTDNYQGQSLCYLPKPMAEVDNIN